MSEALPGTPTGDFLLAQRDLVASGESVYGDPKSPRAVAKLAELEAKIAFGRQIGELPAANPWTIERAAAERLAQEHPMGDPAEHEISEGLAEHYEAQFDRLDALDAGTRASLADQVAQDISDHASALTMPHASYRDGGYPSGHAIVDALVKEAEAAINAFAEPESRGDFIKLLRCDRRLLETFAARGRNLQRYTAAKTRYGLK